MRSQTGSQVQVVRPGQPERFILGISTKPLNERLRKLLDYGLIAR